MPRIVQLILFISLIILSSCTEVLCPDDHIIQIIKNPQNPGSLTLQTGKWTAVNTGTTAILRGVDFPDNGQVGYICGMNGTMLKTTDGGLTFTQQSTATTQNLYRVEFITPDTGYAVGDNHVLIKTTDGGATWSSNLVPIYSGRNFRSVKFFDVNNGIVGATNGELYKTTNGGASWTIIAFAAWQYTAYSLDWTDINHGDIGCNYGSLFKYDNGSVTQVSTGYNGNATCAIWGMYRFSDTEKFLVVSDNNSSNSMKKIDYTKNAWTSIQNTFFSSVYDTIQLQSLKFYNRATGLVIGGNHDYGKSLVLLSTDSGKTWQKQSLTNAPHLFDIAFSKNSAVVVGYGGSVLKSGEE